MYRPPIVIHSLELEWIQLHAFNEWYLKLVTAYWDGGGSKPFPPSYKCDSIYRRKSTLKCKLNFCITFDSQKN